MIKTVQRDTTVFLEYTLKDDHGNVIDSNRGETPLVYTHGWSEIIPGVEREIEGMRPGQEKHITVPPEDGYGPVDPTAELAVPKELVPPDGLKVGAHLDAKVGTGETKAVRVKEISDTTVILDLNHPLAGRTLHYDVRVLRVEPADA